MSACDIARRAGVEWGTALHVSPVRAAIVNDYSVVLAGVSALLAPFRDRVEVAELDANCPPANPRR